MPWLGMSFCEISLSRYCASALVVRTLVAVLPLNLWVDEANAQCVGFPVQTNQTCTNSGTLADTSVRGINNVGLQDLGTLSLTNTTPA